MDAIFRSFVFIISFVGVSSESSGVSATLHESFITVPGFRVPQDLSISSGFSPSPFIPPLSYSFPRCSSSCTRHLPPQLPSCQQLLPKTCHHLDTHPSSLHYLQLDAACPNQSPDGGASHCCHARHQQVHGSNGQV